MSDFDLCTMDWQENLAFFLLFLIVGMAIGQVLAFVASKFGLWSAQMSSSAGHFGIGCIGILVLSGVAWVGIAMIFDPGPNGCGHTPDTVIFAFFLPVLPVAAIATYMRRFSGN